MCWLPIDQPLLLPGDSTCSSSSSSARRPSPCSVAQLLASRLRRIGDQLEKGWTAGGADGGGCCSSNSTADRGSAAAAAAGRGHLQSFFLCTALHLTVLVLFVARRHL